MEDLPAARACSDSDVGGTSKDDATEDKAEMQDDSTATADAKEKDGGADDDADDDDEDLESQVRGGTFNKAIEEQFACLADGFELVSTDMHQLRAYFVSIGGRRLDARVT